MNKIGYFGVGDGSLEEMTDLFIYCLGSEYHHSTRKLNAYKKLTSFWLDEQESL